MQRPHRGVLPDRGARPASAGPSGSAEAGAIAGPTYGAILVASGGGVALAAIGSAAPALLAGIVIALLPRYASDADAAAHQVRADPEGVAAT